MHISMPIRRLMPAGLCAAALIVAACGSPGNGSSATTSPPATSAAPSSSPASSPASGTELKTAKVSGKTVLADSKGFILYSFAPDTSTTSKCTGGCATVWPPEDGPATAGPGVTGKLGTITRSDGSSQATYNGHPLYTYQADSAPGQANGNGINTFGGVWRVVPASGGAAPAPSGSPSGQGGY